MGVLTTPVQEHHNTGHLKACFGREKKASLSRLEHRYHGGGRQEYGSCFCNCPFCEDTQNLKARVHVTAWTRRAPFAILDPITFMKEVCVIP